MLKTSCHATLNLAVERPIPNVTRMLQARKCVYLRCFACFGFFPHTRNGCYLWDFPRLTVRVWQDPLGEDSKFTGICTTFGALDARHELFFCFGGRGGSWAGWYVVSRVSFFMLYASPDMSGARNPIEVERQHLNRVASCLHSYSLHVIIYTADMDHINCSIDSLGSALGKHESPREALSIL